MCASTGNTSASAAAYAARAGLTCGVVIPEGHDRAGQARAGADPRRAGACRCAATSTRRSTSCASSGERGEVTVVNSINPFRIEGQKTAAFEIVDALGDAPDVHCIPVGNAGNITAYWRGYGEYQRLGRSDRTPAHARLAGRGVRRRSCRGEPVLHPETIATAIRIGNPARGTARSPPATSRAVRSARSPTRRSSTPTGELAATEGVFVEPASAASVAGLRSAVADGLVRRGERVVCTVTGHGLKDPQRARSKRCGSASRSSRTRRRGCHRARPAVTPASSAPREGSMSTNAIALSRSSPARRQGSALPLRSPLADRGHDLVLVARDTAWLEALAQGARRRLRGGRRGAHRRPLGSDRARPWSKPGSRIPVARSTCS